MPKIPRPIFVDRKTRPNARLFRGDAMTIMAGLRAESVDMVFADPPYGLSNGGMTCHAGKRVSVDKGAWDKSRGLEKDLDFHQSWLRECRRVLKPDGSLWVSGSHHSIYICGFALQSGGWHVLNDISWYKPNAAPHLACRMFAHSHETLIWARKSKKSKHYFDYNLMRDKPAPDDCFKKKNRQMRSVWAINSPPPPEKFYGKHPTQKPLNLLARVVLASCPKGGTVLDPFCGSATTGVAAVLQGRRFIGIDDNSEYLRKLAVPRLKDALAGKSGRRKRARAESECDEKGGLFERLSGEEAA